MVVAATMAMVVAGTKGGVGRNEQIEQHRKRKSAHTAVMKRMKNCSFDYFFSPFYSSFCPSTAFDVREKCESRPDTFV